MSEKIGFIGLGIMGGHMARHMSERYDLMVFDIDPVKVSAIEKAKRGESVAEVGGYADIVLLSLPTSPIVRQVALGDDGLIGIMEKGKVLIDTSTTEPAISREIASRFTERGVDFMDAPVSGGEGGARNAALAVMAGADQQVFDRYSPYLKAFGKSVVRVGEIGAGGVAKLVNNMIVGSAFAVIAESFALGMKNGLDPAVLYDAIKDGWAGSMVLNVAAPGIIARNFVPGGSIDVLFKDIGYALSLARSQNIPVPMTAMVDEIFKAARATGRGPMAQQVIIQLWEDLLGLNNGGNRG